MMHISLFSGIGGFELAAEWSGWQNIASCEINEFGAKVLNYYWPNAYHHDDIHTFTYEVIDEQLTERYGLQWRSDDIILTGGFPCQPYSAAGKRLGNEDDRHLWPQMLRIIREVRPTWVVGENVLGLVNWNGGLVFDEVQADLEAEGYEVQPYVLPAAGVGAPHRRDRVWFVAHNSRQSIKQKAKRGRGKRGREWSEMGSVDSAVSQRGTTPDTNNTGARERLRIDSQRQENDERWEGQPQPEFGKNSEVSPDPKSQGRGEGIGQGIDTQGRQTGEHGQERDDIRNDIGTGRDAEATSDPYISTKESPRSSGKPNKKGSKKPDVEGKWGSKAEQHSGFDHVSSDATDSNCSGLQTQGAEQQATGSFQHGELGEWDAANSDLKKQRADWRDFPTQPPVRSRNDGFSPELAGITVSKHRNESIKAYGNAIVPQVAHQIFKAIQQYKDQLP